MATKRKSTSVFRPAHYPAGFSLSQYMPQPAQTPAAANIGYQAPAQSGGVPMGYDVNSDPAVAAAHGLAEKIRARAQAVALAKRQQAAIEYGDPSGVEGLDDKTKQAATDNPFSITKNLQHSYETGTRDLEENLNKGNLFYSGYRGQQLGEAAREYQNQRYQAGTNFRGALTGFNDELANALLQADMYEQNSLLNSNGGPYDTSSDEPSGDPNVQHAFDTGRRQNPGTGVVHPVMTALMSRRRIAANERRRAQSGRGT